MSLLQSCVKTFLPQNVPLLTPKIHYGALFQPAIPKTRQECVYTTLYKKICNENNVTNATNSSLSKGFRNRDGTSFKLR